MSTRSFRTRRLFIREAHRYVGMGYRKRPVMVQAVTVHPQRNKWSCGPMALRHCLLAYGVDVPVQKLAFYAGTTRDGSDEHKLKRAARRLKFTLDFQDYRTAASAKQAILSLLDRGRPLLLCIDNWDHWIAVLHHSRRGFLVFDSNRPGPVIQLRSWSWLKSKLRVEYSSHWDWYFGEDHRPIYSVYPLYKTTQSDYLSRS